MASAMKQREVEEDGEVRSFRLIDDLQSAGINVADIKKLQEAGLATIGSVLQCSSRDLIAIKGLSEGITRFKSTSFLSLHCSDEI